MRRRKKNRRTRLGRLKLPGKRTVGGVRSYTIRCWRSEKRNRIWAKTSARDWARKIRSPRHSFIWDRRWTRSSTRGRCCRLLPSAINRPLDRCSDRSSDPPRRSFIFVRTSRVFDRPSSSSPFCNVNSPIYYCVHVALFTCREVLLGGPSCGPYWAILWDHDLQHPRGTIDWIIELYERSYLLLLYLLSLDPWKIPSTLKRLDYFAWNSNC